MRRIRTLVVAVLIVGSTYGVVRGSMTDVLTGTWTPAGLFADARTGSAAVSLPDGRTLIAGGNSVEGAPTDAVVVYDPVAGSFTTVGHLVSVRVGHTATLLDDGRVLVVGGTTDGLVNADLELFDSSSGMSSLVAVMGQPRSGHAAARLADGTVLIVGGSSTDGVVLQSAEIFDPTTNGLTLLTSGLVQKRTGVSATTLIDGRVLVAGGNDGTADLGSAEIYYPLAQTFSPVPTQLSVPRAGHVALLLPHNNGVLIAGGTSAGQAVTTADLFMPAIFPDPFSYGVGEFVSTGAMSGARSRAIAGAAGGDGLAFAAGGGVADAEHYHFATIKTDKDDYAPGERAVITGAGWQPGAEVTLLFQEDPAVHADYVLTVVADSEGKIFWDQWAPESHDFGVRFYLTARDTQSRAQTTFTDGNRVTFSDTANGSAVSDFGTVVQSVCRAAFVQERQGNNLDPDGHVARLVALSSNPANATFFAGSSCAGAAISSITIPANQVSIVFSFRFTTTGDYVVNGDGGLSGNNNASAEIEVVAANNAPTAASQSVNTNEDTDVVVTLSGSDADGDTLSFIVDSLPTNGSLYQVLTDNVTAGTQITTAPTTVTNAAHKVLFRPDQNENGSPYSTFTFKVNDGTVDSTTATVTVTVVSVNDEPAGTDTAVSTDEDSVYTFAVANFGFTDPNDVPSNAFKAVRIASLPGVGTLAVTGGPPLSAGNSVLVTDITAGKLTFTPAANASGTPYASFTFQVQDDGGTTSGGVDVDQVPNTMTVNVTAVNDPPTGTSNSVTTNEDMAFVFATTHFGFSDPNDIPANGFAAIKVTTLPGAGSLQLNGVSAAAGVFITLSDINAGKLTFVPAANASGTPYTSFTFQVQDDGGTTNGGLDLDQSPDTMTINVTAVNDPPSGADTTVTTNEDTAYVFTPANFGFTDPNDTPANSLLAVKVTTLPVAGTLAVNGVPVATGAFVSAADIAAAKLTFTPASNANGDNYASFMFQVQDNGGTDNGGGDLDMTPNTITIDVVAVNDPPTGTDAVVTTDEDTTYTFAASNFGFADPTDTPPNAFAAVKIASLPANGMLSVMGIPATVGQAVSLTDINSGKLTFAPAANANGSPYASFTFQVQDDGGTDNGGVDLDPTPNTITVNVIPVNDPPAAVNDAHSTNEDTALSVVAPGVLGNDTDLENDALTAVLQSGPAHATSFSLNANGSFGYTPALNFFGSDSFTYQACDNGTSGNPPVAAPKCSATVTVTITVVPVNDAPDNLVVGLTANEISENGSTMLSGSFADVELGDSHIVTINWGDGTSPTILTLGPGIQTIPATSHTYLDDSPTGTASDAYEIVVTVTDNGKSGSPLVDDFKSAIAGGSITVKNVIPEIGGITGPAAPIALGLAATITATFTDIGTNDTHSCHIDWDNGTSSVGTVTESAGSGSCSATKMYPAPGVYTVIVTIRDDDTGQTDSKFEFIVVFDPDGGFVTGGGWIMSPPGAYLLDDELVGKANFGFVSKYKKGSQTPEGQTEFQFKAGDLNFHSSAYDAGSLVISNFKAQYKGTGTINDQPGYKFILTAYDGNIQGGGGVDRFRMKIIRISDNAVVYDNARDASDDIDAANPLAIGGGSIVIHDNKKK